MKMRKAAGRANCVAQEVVLGPPDLAVVEVGLGGVEADHGDVVEPQRVPARPDELLEVHVADVARVVVAGDHHEGRVDALAGTRAPSRSPGGSPSP